MFWTIVVAQLVERLLTTPEVRGSDPVNGTFYRSFTVNCIEIWKDEKKRKKKPRMVHFKKQFLKVLPFAFIAYIVGHACVNQPYSLVVETCLGRDWEPRQLTTLKVNIASYPALWIMAHTI